MHRHVANEIVNKVPDKISDKSLLNSLKWPLMTACMWLALMPMAEAQLQFLPTPPDQGAPDGRQRGGATRGDCLAYEDLTALVPQIDGVVWSQTTSQTPAFFFDIPASLSDEILLEFVVQDSNDEYAFVKQFSVEMASGILAIPVTGAQSGLVPGERYSWTFSIYCDPQRPSASVSVFGSVVRVADPLRESSIETAEASLLLAEKYAASGIWHESLDALFQLVQSDPSNAVYRQHLTALLEQGGLMNISSDDTEIETSE